MSRKRSIVFMMSLAVGFLIAAVVFWIIPTDDPSLNMSGDERWLRRGVDSATGQRRPTGLPHPDWQTRVVPGTGLAWMYSDALYPYRGFTLPLAIVGIGSMLVGLILYRRD